MPIPTPISMEIRSAVLEQLAKGTRVAEIADLYDISTTSVYTIKKTSNGGGTPAKATAGVQWIGYTAVAEVDPPTPPQTLGTLEARVARIMNRLSEIERVLGLEP
jgi:hypothetical protein